MVYNVVHLRYLVIRDRILLTEYEQLEKSTCIIYIYQMDNRMFHIILEDHDHANVFD